MSTPIMGKSILSADQMRTYLNMKNSKAPDYTNLYLQMEKSEGVRADIAFAQSVLETNYWKFGGVGRDSQIRGISNDAESYSRYSV